MAQQPLGASSALRFRFYRTPSHTSEAAPIYTSDLHQSWYTPSADDIGSVISVHCSSVVDEKVSRYVSCDGPLAADEELVDIVHSALQKNYFGVKRVVICSSRGSSRSNSMDSHESSSGRPRLHRSDSYGSSADVEVGGSIEVSSEHVLLREKDKNDCGVSLVPSPHMHVECVAPTSLQIYAPVLVISTASSATPINSIHDLQSVKKRRMVNWLGPPRGALYYGLKDYFSESSNHRRAASASMVDQISMTELHSESNSLEHALPGELLRLTIVCRDRLTRDALVMVLRSMTISVPDDMSYETSIPLRLHQLPWVTAIPHSLQPETGDCPGDSGASALTDSATSVNDATLTETAQYISALELEIQHLKQELNTLRSKEEMTDSCVPQTEVTSTVTSELTDLVQELQNRLQTEEKKTAHLESSLSRVMIENSELVAQHALEVAALEKEINEAKVQLTLPQTPAPSSTREEVISPQQQYRIEMLERQLHASQTRCEALLGELSQVIVPAEARYESPSVEVDGDCYNSLSSVGIVASGIRAMTRDSMMGLVGDMDSPSRDGLVRRIESFRRMPEGDYQSDVLSLRDAVLRLQNRDTDETKRKEIMDSMIGLLDAILLQLSEKPVACPTHTSCSDLAVACDAPMPPSRSASSEADGQTCFEGSAILQLEQHNAQSTDTALAYNIRGKMLSLVNEIRAVCSGIDPALGTYRSEDNAEQGDVDLLLSEVRERVLDLIRRLSDDVSKSSASSASLEAQNESLQRQILSLKDEYNEHTCSLKCEVDALVKACEQATTDYSNMMEKFQKQTEDLQSLNSSLKEECAQSKSTSGKKDEIIQELKERCESVCAELFVEKAKVESLIAQHTESSNGLAASKLENAKLSKECIGLKKECSRLKETIATVQRNKEPLAKMKADMESSLAAMERDKQQLLQDFERIEGENSELVQYIGVLESQCEESKARIAELTDTVALLQAETLHLSDDRQHISKQLASYDTLRHQVAQLRSQLVESDQTLHATKNMLHETIAINETLEAQHKELASNLQIANATIAKKSLDLVELHAQLESLEKGQKTYERDKAGLRKENARLRDMMIKLEEDRESLYKLRPVYNEQFCELTRCRTAIQKLEEDLNMFKQSDLEKRSQIADLEETVVQLECRAENCLLQANRSGMIAQNDYHNSLRLAAQLCDLERTIKKLSGELDVARQAEPLKIKQLEYMLARTVGEKNHFENKVYLILVIFCCN